MSTDIEKKELEKALKILNVKFANFSRTKLLEIILTLGAKIKILENELEKLKEE